MYNNVTAVLTSCGRLDLLEKTIKSLSQEFWDKIPVKLLTEDSSNPKIFDQVKKENETGYLKGWTILYNEKKLGQSASIDRAYSLVKTDYVFHLEDDWFFTGEDFIDRSLPILEKYDNILQVTFREGEPHQSGDDIYEEGTESAFKVWIPGWKGFPGFTYNPNIFKISAYNEIKPISGRPEKEVGFQYVEMGLHTVVLQKRYVRHIGDGRHVPLNETLW